MTRRILFLLVLILAVALSGFAQGQSADEHERSAGAAIAPEQRTADGKPVRKMRGDEPESAHKQQNNQENPAQFHCLYTQNPS